MAENELRNVLQNATYSAGIAILARAILFLSGYHPATLFDEIGLDLILILSSLILLVLILFFRIRGPISVLLGIDTTIDRKIRKQFYQFIVNDLDRLHHVLLDAQSVGGAELVFDDVNTLTHICFERSEAKYDGTDSNVPSIYYTLYPKYLEAHEKTLKYKGHKPGSRILIVKQDDLKDDFMRNYGTFFKFIRWHIENKVGFRVIDPELAIRISREYNIPDNITDIGIWHGKFVLLFKPLGNGKVKLYMRFEGNDDYTNTIRYFRELSRNAVEVDFSQMIKGVIPVDLRMKEQNLHMKEQMERSKELFEYRLAVEWEDFVFCRERLKLEKLFLDTLISKYRKGQNDYVIFDAAAGTGCESRYLLEKGLRVISNEISPYLQTIAYQALRNAGLSPEHLEISSLNWLELDKRFGEEFENLKVDMVLLLGNSLCLLPNKSDIIKSLSNVRSILKPEGVLVIDERNFEYILKNKASILKDPIKNFRFSGEIIYCGVKAKGVPTEISDNNVRFTYYKVPPRSQQDVDTWKILDPKSKYFIGTLDMYPFRKNELKRYLREAGFTNISEYSDFEEGYREEADFYFYVAQAPS